MEPIAIDWGQLLATVILVLICVSVGIIAISEMIQSRDHHRWKKGIKANHWDDSEK